VGLTQPQVTEHTRAHQEKGRTIMKRTKKILAALAGAAVVTLAVAQVPVATVDPSRHGNLAAAQQNIQQAFNSISAAQQANEDQLGGHAARAKEYLREANDEIAAAAVVADNHQGAPSAMAAPPSATSAPPGVNTPAPPATIAGKWTIYAYNTNQPGSSLKQVVLNQNGNIISGTFHGPNQHGKLQGWINGNHVEFSTDTREVLTFRGEITPTGMSGMYGIHGQTAPWNAERTN
jgi:hypothetical protein